MKQYKMTFDLHTHTTFSHGKGSIEDNVKAAITAGLNEVGIADHGPGHVLYGFKREAVPEMRREIERLTPLYPQIKITLTAEANIINLSGNLDIKKEEFPQYDCMLAGYHYGVFGEKPLSALCLLIENGAHEKLGISLKRAKIRNTEMTIRALYENDIRILTHPGDKGEFDIPAIAKACEETGTWMEINTWHRWLTVEAIRESAKTGAVFVISSDAHTPDRVGSFQGGLDRAKEAGLDLSRIVNIEEI